MQPRPRLPTLSGTRPWLPTLSFTPLRPAEHYHTYGELELNRKTPWFACKVLVQHDCTHSQRKPCIPISAMSWSAACKIVVLGPSSAACGNVAAMHDVLVCQSGWEGRAIRKKRIWNMQSAHWAQLECDSPKGRHVAGHVETDARVAQDCIDTCVRLKRRPPIPRPALRAACRTARPERAADERLARVRTRGVGLQWVMTRGGAPSATSARVKSFERQLYGRARRRG